MKLVLINVFEISNCRYIGCLNRNQSALRRPIVLIIFMMKRIHKVSKRRQKEGRKIKSTSNSRLINVLKLQRSQPGQLRRVFACKIPLKNFWLLQELNMLSLRKIKTSKHFPNHDLTGIFLDTRNRLYLIYKALLKKSLG